MCIALHLLLRKDDESELLKTMGNPNGSYWKKKRSFVRLYTREPLRKKSDSGHVCIVSKCLCLYFCSRKKFFISTSIRRNFASERCPVRFSNSSPPQLVVTRKSHAFVIESRVSVCLSRHINYSTMSPLPF